MPLDFEAFGLRYHPVDDEEISNLYFCTVSMSVRFHGKIEQGGLAVGSIIRTGSCSEYFLVIQPDIFLVDIVQSSLDQVPVGIVTASVCTGWPEIAIKGGYITGMVGQGTKAPVICVLRGDHLYMHISCTIPRLTIEHENREVFGVCGQVVVGIIHVDGIPTPCTVKVDHSLASQSIGHKGGG